MANRLSLFLVGLLVIVAVNGSLFYGQPPEPQGIPSEELNQDTFQEPLIDVPFEEEEKVRLQLYG
jgi:hypothetical protein